MKMNNIKMIITEFLSIHKCKGLYHLDGRWKDGVPYDSKVDCRCHLNKDLFDYDKCHLKGPLFCYPFISDNEKNIKESLLKRIDEIIKLYLIDNDYRGFKSINYDFPCACSFDSLFSCYYQDPHNCLLKR